MSKTAKEVNPWTMMLAQFDASYFEFDEDEDAPKDVHDTAYRLATWYFDSQSDEEALRKLLKLPQELWIEVLCKFRDGDHDT